MAKILSTTLGEYPAGSQYVFIVGEDRSFFQREKNRGWFRFNTQLGKWMWAQKPRYLTRISMGGWLRKHALKIVSWQSAI